MSKPRFQFYFADEPQRATFVERAWLANTLRAYRKHADRYQLRRHGLHHYSVRHAHGSAVGVISI